MSKLLIALPGDCRAGICQRHRGGDESPRTMSTPMTKDNYTMAKTNADAQYKIDNDACSSLKGNAKDVCVAEAKGKDNVTKADAEAAYV